MKCAEARSRIAGYVDNELDDLECMRLDSHVSTCGACQHERAQQVFVSQELRREVTRYRAPARLHRRVRESLREGGMRGEPWWRRMGWSALVPAAGVAFAALFSANIFFLASVPSAEDRVAGNVLDSHLRALMTARPIDVASSDQHTVKPWYAGRLDFSPPVVDYAAEGFPLIGGRVDYVDGRSVAALVYQHRKHVVDAFIWPAGGSSPKAPATLVQRGYNLVHWTHDGMTYWLASDLEAAELMHLEALLASSSSM